jgi:hypothetical protein
MARISLTWKSGARCEPQSDNPRGDDLMRSWLGVVAAIALAGCSTPTSIPAERPTIQTYAENYQEIYQRVSTTAKRCFASKAGVYASATADASLFPEIGYGVVTLAVVRRGTDNYYLSVRIENQPTGSKITMISDNTAASQRYRELVSAWATGDQNCPPA